MTETVTLHPFETAGLGLAPFRFTGLEEKVFNNGDGTTRAGSSCDYCYTAIRYCCWIVSHDGKRFKVGTDCVRKLGRADNRLVSAVNRELAKIAKAKKDAARAAKWEAARLAREAVLDAERARNGGLTDWEVADAKRKADADALAAGMVAKNRWLLDVLDRVGYRSDFIDGMIEKLERMPVKELSDRCREILKDVFSKARGRRGSKKYLEAEAEFDRLAN